MRIRKQWAGLLLPTVGIRLNVYGNKPDYPCLLVANHRSYLDPILILKDINAYPVAKAELANWPVIGKGAQMAGILYLKREQASSRVGTLKQMLDRIKAGYPILIFPEGTTSGRTNTLPFKKGGFKMSAQNEIPIVPVAICYEDMEDYWVGNISFLKHAIRQFSSPEIKIDLYYGDSFTGNNPDLLLQQTQEWIDRMLLDNCRARLKTKNYENGKG